MKTATTATAMLERRNLRRLRADRLTHMLMHLLDDYLGRLPRREIHERLLDLFYESGAELITDDDRQTAGLPPRGPDGWTDEEVFALEKMRLDRLLNPPPIIIPKLADQ